MSKQGASLRFRFSVTAFLLCVLLSALHLGFLPDPELYQTSIPTTLWTHYIQKPILFLNRVQQEEWSWTPEQVAIRETEMGIVLSLPGSRVYYQPKAPKLPYLKVSIPLHQGDSIAYMKTLSIRWKPLSFPMKELAFHSDLMTASGVETSSIALGIHLPKCFPEPSFSYSAAYLRDQTECQLKLFPIHTWNNQVWLIEHLRIEIGLVTTRKPDQAVKTKPDSVIISPDELMEEAQQLGRIHQKNGYNPRVIPLSHIQHWGKEVDPLSIANMIAYREADASRVIQIPDYDFKTADKIRGYLAHLLRLDQIDYLTLFGDATYIPPSEYVISVHNPDPYDRMIPTDLFYMSPEAQDRELPLRIITGRIPVRSKEEAINYIRKYLLYRLSSQQDWAKSIALFGGDMFEDDYYGELQACFMANNGDFGDLSTTKFFETENQYNRNRIMQVLSEEDFGFLLMSSHGRGDYLRLPEGYIDAADIMNQKPKSRFPIFVSNSCLNGAWDTRLSNIRLGTGPSLGIPTSFAESLLFSNGGAIAYIGGARVNYAGMDYNSDLGEMKVYQLYNIDAMIRYFFQSYQTGDQTLGEVFAKSIQTYIAKDFDNGYEPTIKTLFGFCLLGDPTLSLPDKHPAVKAPITLKKKPVVKTGPIDEGSPFVSIFEQNNFEFSSQSEIATVKLCDYNHPQNGLIEEKSPQFVQTNLYRYTLPTIKKTRFALRIENNQGYEIRYVASGRFNQDIALPTPSVYKHLEKGIPFEFVLSVQNIGLSSMTNINIEQISSTEAKCLYSLPNLDPYMVYPVKTQIDTSSSGTFVYQFTCFSTESEDMDAVDNTIEIQFEVSETPYHRIGVIGYSWYGLKDNVDDILQLDVVNEYYQDRQLPLEVKSLTDEDLNAIETLSLSTLVLYDSGYIPNQESLTMLKKQASKGGSLLVIGQFDDQLQSLMGYDNGVSFSYHTGDSSFQPFSMMKSKEAYFSLETYHLPCFESYTLAESDLTDSLRNTAFIIGYSEDQMLYLIQNNRCITYSGFLSKLDFRRSEETLVFFAELLSYSASQSKKQKPEGDKTPSG